MIHPADDRALDEAAERLRRGGLVAFPTETVYGLGANAWDADAVRRIFAAKGRPANNPLIVHVAGVEQLELAMASPADPRIAGLLDRLRPFWPGPLTVIVPRNPRIPDIVTAGLPSVGVRVPAHPVALALLRRCAFPVAAPSANPSNYVSPTRAEHVDRDLGSRVDMVLDGGPCAAGVESTIVSLVEDPPRVLRVGALPVESLSATLGVPVAGLLRTSGQDRDERAGALSSPGQLPEHYAPRTPLVLAHELASKSLPPRFGWIEFREGSASGSGAEAVITLSPTGRLEDVARGLFAALRQLDRQSLDMIVVDVCEEEGLGRAIMDRLRRARRKQ